MFKRCATFATLFLLTACGGTSEQNETSNSNNFEAPKSQSETAELPIKATSILKSVDEAYVLWKTFEIDDYRLYVEKTCLCPEEMKNKTAWVVAYGQPDQVLPTRGADYSTSTVERLLTKISEAAAEEENEVSADYHPIYGYPTKIIIKNRSSDGHNEVTYNVELQSNHQIKDEIAKNKALWESKNINDYSMTYRTKCVGDCSWLPNNTFVIEVRNRELFSAAYADGGAIDDVVFNRAVTTIEQQFATLQTFAGFAAAEISVEFDALGYPKSSTIYSNALYKDFVLGGDIVAIEIKQ